MSGGNQRCIGQLCLQPCELGFIGPKAGLRFGDIFLSRSRHGQVQGLLGHLQARLGHVHFRAGVVHILLAGRTAGDHLLQAVMPQAGVFQVHPSRLYVGSRLGDLFRARSVLETLDDVPLRFHFPPGLQHRSLQAILFENSQFLAGLHMIPFFHQEPGNALRSVECQRHLPQVHIAVEGDLPANLPLLPLKKPVSRSPQGRQQDDQQ